jgi:uncharacterized protein (DUF927 family)
VTAGEQAMTLLQAIECVRHDGRSRNVRCPAHDDRRPSLSVSRGDDGRVLLHCHAGCETDDILKVAGLTWADLHERRNGKPAIVATYDYHDENGALLYQVCRLEPKGFFQRRPDGAGGWIRNLKGVRRVLFRLAELRGAQEVYITEGEKDALALVKLGLVATTNSGGAEKWRSGYTRQLRMAGVESVVILPDNDDPGRAHTDIAARSCEAGGLQVKVVTLPGLPPKGDVSDWIAAGHTRDELIALVNTTTAYTPAAGKPKQGPHRNTAAQGESPASSRRPAAKHVPRFPYRDGRFEVTDEGVTFVREEDGNSPTSQWICSPLFVIARTRDAKSGEWGRLLEWCDDDGISHRWTMPLELLQGDGLDVRRELARLGLSIAPSRVARDLLANYIQLCPVNDRARCVDRLGWHNAVFVTPTETIGDPGELVVFQNAHAVEPEFSTLGTVQAWRDSVAALAPGNTRIVFAVSASFAGPLVEMIGEDSGGFHFRGQSSSGKTTALRAAASVWGHPCRYVRTWRATTNGLEGVAALHTDWTLILDELGQIDPKEAGEAAYLLANGQGKARASRNGTARAALRWRLLFLSAGEDSLSALMARVGRRASAGQEIRLADIEADAGAGMGIFEALHRHDSPGSLALALRDAAAGAYGAVGRTWLQLLVTDRAKLAGWIGDGIRQFCTETVPKGAEGQIERVARRFGLVAIAGELASHYGLTGWDKGEGETAAKACFSAFLEAFGGIGNREERELLSQVRAFFEAHGASRFESANGDERQRVINRAGFVRAGSDQSREFLVLPEIFRRELCAGFDGKTSARLLVAHGWVIPGGDGRSTQKLRLPGMGTTPTRVYVFTDKVWESE